MMPQEFDASVFVRPVQTGDAPTLHQMCWPDRTAESVLELLQRTNRLAMNGRGLGAVVIKGGSPCAFGLLTVWPRAAEISDLIVHTDYRGQGMGTMIIHFLTDRARELGVRTLEIGVALSNPRALALYRRLGFIDGRTIDLNLGSGPEPVLYLYKPLAPV